MMWISIQLYRNFARRNPTSIRCGMFFSNECGCMRVGWLGLGLLGFLDLSEDAGLPG